MESNSKNQIKNRKRLYGRGYPRPQSDKDLAINLLKEGNSFRSTARLVGCTHKTVIKWMKEYSNSLPPIEVEDLKNGVEVDELCTFVKKK